MSAPLAPGYRESVLWQEELDAADHAALDPAPGTPPRSVDVAVVGGGYCGLAAATELAGRGASVALFERGTLAGGASSRNGGMVLPELKAGPRSLERRYGPVGLALHREVEAAFDHVEELAGPGGIDADYHRSGQLYLARGSRGARRFAGLAGELGSVGHEAHVVTGAELEREAGSNAFAAGLVIERSGGLQPARFAAGLARRAAAAGADLHPHTQVLALAPAPTGGHDLTTRHGPVRADQVVLATNADAGRVAPGLAAVVLPMGSFIIATAPLPADLSASVLPTRRMAFDDRNFLCYWRHGPGGRLVFGGRHRLGRIGLDEARDHLYSAMVAIHPQLDGTPIERVWGGRVAITLDRLPHCGRIDGLWYATGCNGSGVATNTWMGYRLAGAVLGGELPAFASVPPRRIPLRRTRRAWLPAVGLGLAAADRLDSRPERSWI